MKALLCKFCGVTAPRAKNWNCTICGDTYNIYKSMHSRCYSKGHSAYPYYGGRGIVVDQRWAKPAIIGFKNFMSDMGLRPGKDMTLDRVDVNGPYSPENCRWASRKEQSRNRRDNTILDFQGRSLTVAGWAEELGVSKQLIIGRLKLGWSVEKTLSTPVIEKQKIKNVLTLAQVQEIRNCDATIASLSRKFGVSETTVSYCRKRKTYRFV